MVEDSLTRELEQEQQHFDRARGRYETASAEWDDPQKWSMGTGPERRAMKKNAESKGRLGSNEAVAFGRMFLESGESYHVGKVPISDDEGNKLVISWKSKMAERYYQATTEDSRGVARKRNFTTSQNRVDTFTDKVLADLAARIEGLDEQIRTDDVLLQSLEASRTGQMQDIVRTIQASQDKLMRSAKDQLLIIQGGPGTGKTAVALHRASWLLYNYRDELPADDMLVVGPNPAFTKYIQQVLPALGDQHVRQTSIRDLLAGDLGVRAVEPAAVARIKGKAEMADVIARGLDDRIKTPNSPLRIRRRNSAVTVNVMPQMLEEDIKQLRSEPYGTGREALRERLLSQCATALGLRAGQSAHDIVDPESINAAVDRIWPRLSATQFIRELLGSKQRLRTAASDYLHADEIDMLYRSPIQKISNEPWTVADLALIDEAEDYMSGSTSLWGHIIVDEAQDLSPMELFALRRRSRNGSMTLVGDVAQSTGPFSRQDWEDVADALKSRLSCNIEELRHGYRVPKEIFEIARHLLPIAAPGLRAPTIVRSVKANPSLFDVPLRQLPVEIAKVARHHRSKDRFVGVIAPEELWEEIQEAFTKAGVEWSDSSAGQLGTSINLVTPEGSKGMEFDAVIVVDPQTILDKDNGARLLYIALTRSTHRLDVLCPAGDVPQVLKDAFPHVAVIENEPPGEGSEAAAEEPVKTSERSGPPVAVAAASADLRIGRTGIPEKEPETVNPAGPATLPPLEQELVHRNAEYLYEVILKFYGPDVRRAIVEETLVRLRDRDDEADASRAQG